MHEVGHLIYFFHKARYPYREDIDKYSGLISTISRKSVPHNEYKIEYCKNLLSKNLPCEYKINPVYLKNKEEAKTDKSTYYMSNVQEEKEGYSLDENELLKKFIFEKVKNLKFPGSDSEQQKQFVDYMLLKMFRNSDYGRVEEIEVASEGFAYWLMTPDEKKDKTWEIWNEFLLDYLPKAREQATHFYDYKKIKD